MGQAKARGSYTDRDKDALTRAAQLDPALDDSTLANLKRGLDGATHFAIVIDRSEEGIETATLTKRTFPQHDQAWTQFNSGYEFMILVKGKKEGHQDDQGTLLVLDLATLINQAIPQVCAKVASVGGKTGFILAVAPHLIDEISRAIEGSGSV